MANNNESALSPITEDLYRDLDAIIKEHQLNRKDLSRAEELRGAQLIGTCINTAYDANPVPSLTGVLRDVGKRLNATYVRGFSNTKLMQFAKTANAFPLDITIRPELSWRHLGELSKIEDLKLRTCLMEAAADNDWPEWRIGLHGRGIEEALSDYQYYYRPYHLTPDPDVLRYLRAYTTAFGVIDIHDAQALYCDSDDGLTSRFAIEVTILHLQHNEGKGGEPFIWQNNGHTYVVAPELYPESSMPKYHMEDYRYSYDPYERRNEYADQCRLLRANRLEARRNSIVMRQMEIPAKKIDFDRIVRGDSLLDRLSYQLKQIIAQEYSDEAASGLYEGELEFALEKLLRYIALTGFPSAIELEYDVSFLFYCVGLKSVSALTRQTVTDLLEQVYLQAPIWELHGHSAMEEKAEIQP